MRGKGKTRLRGRAVENMQRGSLIAPVSASAPAAVATRGQPPIRPGLHGAYIQYPTFGALDLGTNNCRLLIARPRAFASEITGANGMAMGGNPDSESLPRSWQKRTDSRGDDFVIVDAYSRIVRLGEGITTSGRMSEPAMDRALAALSACADKLRKRRVVLSRAVATEACRRAANGQAFWERVRNETGIALDVISAEEEARLAVLGCYQSLSAGDGPALLFDIGGGSTEVVLIDDSGDEPVILDWQSIPWGVVTLSEAERHDTDNPACRAAAYAAMRARVREAIAGFSTRIARHCPDRHAGGIRLLGTSGTVTTLASLYLGLASYDRSQVDGLNITAKDMRYQCARLADMSLSDLTQLPCIGRDRADLVIAGCAALEEICDIWPAHSIDVADRGIREGVLRQMMRSHFDRTARSARG